MADTGTITFVPSVHYSTVHRRRVQATIRETAPDVVAVELGEQRFDRLQERANLNLAKLATDLPAGTGATYRALQAVQQSVARLYGFDWETSDMEAAIETATEMDLDVALIDDPIGETMASLSERVGLDTIPKLLVRAQLTGPELWADQLQLMARPVSSITDGDDVQPAVDQLRRLLPELAAVLVDRRDQAMARRLHQLRREGQDVVAVIGAAHHNGVTAALDTLAGQPDDTDVTVPRRSPSRETTTIPVN